MPPAITRPKGMGNTTIMKTVKDFQKEWKKSKSNEKGVLLFIPKTGVFLMAKFGIGDNLLPEDVESGYNDYIYIEELEFEDPDMMNEIGGGQVLFNNEEEDYYKNLSHFIEVSLEEMDMTGQEYIILQLICA